MAKVKSTAAGEARAEVLYSVVGHLEQPCPNSDESGADNLPFALPENAELYWQALLTDDSGSLPVYVAPCLTEEELAKTRHFLVHYIGADTPFFVVEPGTDSENVISRCFKLERKALTFSQRMAA